MRIVIPNADFSNDNIGRLVPEHEEWTNYPVPNQPTVTPLITGDNETTSVLSFYYSQEYPIANINQSCVCINVQGKKRIKARLITSSTDYLYGCVAFSSSDIATVPNGQPPYRINENEVGKTINLVQMTDGKYSKHINTTDEFVLEIPLSAKYVLFCYKKNWVVDSNISVSEIIEEHIEE